MKRVDAPRKRFGFVIQPIGASRKTMGFLSSSAMVGRRKPARPSAGLGPEQIEIEDRLRINLPRWLQREREARRMTQEQLAEKAGVHFTTVGKVERGRLIPSIALLAVLARALDLRLSDVLETVLPEPAGSADSIDEDATVKFVKSLPKAERKSVLRVLETLHSWKHGS